MSNATHAARPAMPKTQADALALLNDETKWGAKRIIAKVANKKAVKCVNCRRSIDGGALYFSKGLRASTLYERQNARKGCVWYNYCRACATS